MNAISRPRRSSATRRRLYHMPRSIRALSRGSACHRFDGLTPQVCHQEQATPVDPHLDRQHTKDSADEASLSAQCSQTCQEARVPVTDEHPRRPCRPPFSSSEGPRPFVGVIERLAGHRAFARLRAEGTRRGRGPIRLVVRPDTSQRPRFAFAIPRTVGTAVVRNRTKRRLRAVLVDLDGTPPGLPGGDHLIRVTAPIDDWSHATLHTTMAMLLLPDPSALDGDRR